jgi:putative CocE/NonD family hydrolase
MKISKLYLSIFLFILAFSSANSQEVTVEWIKENYIKKEVLVPMRDGTKLFTAIYSPKSTVEKHPFLMMRTPYSCAPYGEDKIWGRLYQYYYKEYLKQGYIFVIQDVRGRWMSEGKFEDVRPFLENKSKPNDIDEASDTYDTVDWLLKNVENNNGKVGVFGVSYPGFYATMAAASAHPAVKAVSPQAPVTDWFMGDDFHHNGACMLWDGFNFYSTFGQPRPKPTTKGPINFPYYTNDRYKFMLETGAISNFTKLLADSIEFWKVLMEHPNYDDFWKKRDARQATKNIKPAMLVVGGLFDAEDCFGAWRLYESIEKNNPNTSNKIVMGPWAHGGWGRSSGNYLGNVRFGSNTSTYYQKNIEIPFFNYHLKGMGNIDSLPEASIFFTGENKWRSLSVWPPKEIKKTNVYFLPNYKLGFIPSPILNSYSEYVSNPNKPVPYTEGTMEGRTREYMTDDQRFASQRPDVLTFEMPTLTEDITVAGTLTAQLNVSISTTDADFIVKLIDVFPEKFQYDTTSYGVGNGKDYLMDSYQMLVRGEVMRGKFRNSFEKPEAFEPNKATLVKFDLPDVAHTFKKGHKIMVQIQSTWFPLVDRNPQQFLDIYHCKDSDFVSSTIKLYHDSKYPSSIVLPILK